MKKYRKLLLKVVVSLALFTIIFRNVSYESLADSFHKMDPIYLPVIFLLIVANYVVGAFRWKSFLIHENTGHVTVPYLINLYFIGAFFNNFMPTSVGGDVFKVYKLGKKIGNTTDAFTATFMERFTGVVALVLVSAMALIYLLKAWGILVFAAFWLGMIVAFYALKFFAGKFEKINKIYQSFLMYKGNNKVLVIAFITSFVIQFIAIFTQYAVFSALGFNLPLLYSMFIIPVITLASFFIPSLNGVGVQDALYILFFGEAAYIGLFGGVGVGTEVALSASIIYHLSRLFVSLIGGVLYALGKAD